MPHKAALFTSPQVVIHQVVANEELAQLCNELVVAVNPGILGVCGPLVTPAEDVVHQTVDVIFATEDDAVLALRDAVNLLLVFRQNTGESAGAVIPFSGAVGRLFVLPDVVVTVGLETVNPSLFADDLDARVIGLALSVGVLFAKPIEQLVLSLESRFQRPVEDVARDDDIRPASPISRLKAVRVEIVFGIEKVPKRVLADQVRRTADEPGDGIVPLFRLVFGDVLGSCFAPAEELTQLVSRAPVLYSSVQVATTLNLAIVDAEHQLRVIEDDVLILRGDVQAHIAEGLTDLMAMCACDASLLVTCGLPGFAREDATSHLANLVFVHDSTSFNMY